MTEVKKDAATKPVRAKLLTAPAFTNETKLTLIVTDNPKRGKSKARYDFYKKAKTVGEYIKLGGVRADITWDYERQFIGFAK